MKKEIICKKQHHCFLIVGIKEGKKEYFIASLGHMRYPEDFKTYEDAKSWIDKKDWDVLTFMTEAIIDLIINEQKNQKENEHNTNNN